MDGDQPLVEAAGSTAPALEPGVTCLTVSHHRSVGFHDLVLANLRTRGLVYWIDARNVANTYRLHERAAADRQLSGIRIARAFTAYQHFSLARALLGKVTPRTELVCLPNVASLYRDDDVPAHERDRLLDALCTGLTALAEEVEIPILVSTARDDALADRIAEAADRTIDCESTPFGIRYDGPDVETTVYRDGPYWQTTIPYWVELFGAVDEASLVEAVTAAEFAGVA